MKAQSLLSATNTAKKDAEVEHESAVLKEQAALVGDATGSRDAEVLSFEHEWSRLQTKLQRSDDSYDELVRCVRNSQWAC